MTFVSEAAAVRPDRSTNPSPSAAPARPYRKLLVALEAGKANDAVVHESVRLARQLGASLRAVYINLPSAGKPTMMMEPYPRVSEGDLRRAFASCGYEAEAKALETRITTGRSLVRTLAAETRQADILIVGHQQRLRILSALEVWGVSRQLVELSACPVFVVPR